VESFGIVLIEAAASATPFISVACGSAEEIAAWTDAGEVVPSERRSDGRVIADPQLLAERISALWHDAPRRRRMADAGRAAWFREFTWDRIAKRYEDVYRGALATAG
jgi:glycosyltransferase involved in cell wall biosynthesis